MAWTLWCSYGLNYAFAYACYYDTSMGHYTWYLIPCSELSFTYTLLGSSATCLVDNGLCHWP
jgi:hypothetical protein